MTKTTLLLLIVFSTTFTSPVKETFFFSTAEPFLFLDRIATHSYHNGETSLISIDKRKKAKTIIFYKQTTKNLQPN
ncbi:MAG: hypothetical protein SGI83_11685 [Bacteroidota bacterium]|nr:hypothetical protein [Bacteroidota bacterium]